MFISPLIRYRDLFARSFLGNFLLVIEPPTDVNCYSQMRPSGDFLGVFFINY